MSAWDDMHAEAIESLERPDGCDCGIESSTAVPPPRFSGRTSVTTWIALGGCQGRPRRSSA